MLRLLFCLLLLAASALPASLLGKWKLVSLDADTRGEDMGTVDFDPKSVSFRLSDGTKLMLPYGVTNGVLAGQFTSENRRVFYILRGRFDEGRDSLTMALVIRHLDNLKNNRSLKFNALRAVQSDASR